MIEHRQAAPVDPSRVVVLGASGFVGTDLVRHLEQLGIATLPMSSNQIDLVQPESVEILHKEIHQDDALIVVSALTPDRGRDISTLMKNLTMVQNVCAALAESPCSHLVYISSDAVYQDEANPVREESCCDPSSFHGLMHLARERMLAHTLKDSETPFMILRPSLLYGPGDTHNGYGPNRYLRTAREAGKITLFGDGEEERDHVFIGDLSRLIGLCLKNRGEGTLNVATGTATSFMDVARGVATAVKKEVEIECTPRQVPITHRHFDISATSKAFPSFQFTPLPEGLSETFTAI